MHFISLLSHLLPSLECQLHEGRESLSVSVIATFPEPYSGPGTQQVLRKVCFYKRVDENTCFAEAPSSVGSGAEQHRRRLSWIRKVLAVDASIAENLLYTGHALCWELMTHPERCMGSGLDRDGPSPAPEWQTYGVARAVMGDIQGSVQMGPPHSWPGPSLPQPWG